MENQLFFWVDWDIQDTFTFTFYECTLQKDIGKYKAGTVIPVINLCYQNAKMDFINEDGTKVLDSFDLKLEVE